jgi:hypothetical protein
MRESVYGTASRVPATSTPRAERKPVRRPLSITVVATALCLAAGIATLVGAALLFPGTFRDEMWQYNRPAHAAFQTMGRGLGDAFIALGLLAGSTAAGLFRGHRWAWWLAIGIFAINGLGDVIGFIQTRDAIRSGSGILFAAAFLGLLLINRSSTPPPANHPS